MRGFLVLSILLALAAAGCRPPGGQTLGAAVGAIPVVTVREAGAARTSVALQGVLVEKCPVAACWFRLKDATGTMKVDLKSAGFTVTDIPRGAQVTVAGTIDRGADAPTLVASGLRW